MTNASITSREPRSQASRKRSAAAIASSFATFRRQNADRRPPLSAARATAAAWAVGWDRGQTGSKLRPTRTPNRTMTVDSSQPIPLYFQLKTLLLEEILGGVYGRDGRLPTEHELCRSYRISRTPVSRALSELADEGVILRHRRRGTFVNPHWLRRRADQREVRVVVRRGAVGGGWFTPPRTPDIAVERRHGPAPDAPPDADARRRGGPRARPRAARLGLGCRSSRAAGFLHALEELDEQWVQRRARDGLPPRGRGREPLRRPHVRRLGLRRRRRALVPARRARGASRLEPPATWASCARWRARSRARDAVTRS